MVKTVRRKITILLIMSMLLQLLIGVAPVMAEDSSGLIAEEPEFAPLLAVTLSAGETTGATSATINDPVSGRLLVNVTEQEISLPQVGDIAPSAGANFIADYESGADITAGVAAGSYLQIYDVDMEEDRIIAFYQAELTEADIKEADMAVELAEEPVEDSLEDIEEDVKEDTEEEKFAGGLRTFGIAPMSSGGIVATLTLGENVTGTLYTDGELVVSGTGPMNDFEDGTSPIFSWRGSIKYVVINSGVTSIGNSAFYYCSMPSIDIPSSVTSIGSKAFHYCRDLSSITIPDSVESIGDEAFWACVSKLESITIPGSVKSIGYRAFYVCNSLTRIINLYKGNQTIGTDAFTSLAPEPKTAVADPDNTNFIDAVTAAGFTVSYFYNVTFKDWNGTVLKTEAVEIGKSATPPDDPIRNGYAFQGWSGSYTNVTSDQEVTATYEIINYTITYNLDGGANGANQLSYNIETPTITLQNAIRTGYTFAGWFDAPTGGSKITSIPKGSTGNKTLYARWTPNTYTVTFNANGGGTPSTASKSVTYDSTYGVLATTSRTGYNFKGWFPAASGGTQITAATEVKTTSNQTLYAQWDLVTYTITYNLDGGANGANPANYNIETLTITLQNAIKTGYTFAGWFDAPTGGSKITSIPKGSTGNKTLFTRWTPNTYTVTFNANGGGTPSTASKSVTYDSTYGVLATTSRTGYNFKGWFPAASGGTQITAATEVKTTSNQTLYAQWDLVTYTITYNLDGGANGANPPSYNIETPAITLQNATKTGYTFAGWFDAPTGGNKVTSIPQGSTGNKTLFARWTPNTNTAYKVEHYQQNISGAGYTLKDTDNLSGTTASAVNASAKTYTGFTENTIHADRVASGTIAADGTLVLKLYYDRNTHTVSFNSNGGFAVSGITGVRYGATIAAPDAPTRTGYTFAGWYKEAGLTSTWHFGTDTVTADTDLYAKWTVNQYTITFNSNGGSNVDSITQDYGTAVTAPANPTREGYTFSVWNPAVPSIIPAENTTVTAQWALVTYTITYNLDGGANGANPANYNIVTPAITLQNAAKTGYTFAGWFDAPTGGSKITSIPLGSTENKTLFARWTPNTNTAYKVEHYQQNISGAGYTLKDTDNLSGTTASAVNASAKTYTGFTENTIHADRVASGTIAADGTLVLKLYYDRNTHTVSFNSNGGFAVSGITGVRYGATIAAPDAPTRTGYTFAGWYKEAGLTSTWHFGTDTVTADTDLYAKWTVNQYTITFNSNGGSNVDSIAQDYGTAVTAPANPTREGYTFSVWNPAVPSIIPAVNTTVIAQWDLIIYTITYNLDGGANGANPASYNIETPAITLQNAAKTGYTFAGWFDAATDGSKIASIPQGSTGNKTLYARWTPNTNTSYKVEHYQQDASGAGYTLKDTDNLSGTTASAVNASAKTYTGFTENTIHADRVASGTIAADGTLVLKLYYDRNTHTVSFNSNGGSAVSDITGVRYGATIAAPAAPTKTGYTFAGWCKEEGLTSTWDFGIDTVTADTNLYAKWTINQYTITFNSNGGSEVTSQTLDYNSLADEPTALTRQGYTFAGWYKESELINPWDFATDKIPAENITLYAKWTPTGGPSQGSAVVIVNGKEHNAGTERKTTEDEKSTVIIEVNNQAIESKINEAVENNPTGTGNVIQIPVADTSSQVAKMELTGDIVKKLEENAFDVSITRDNVEYSIPAVEFTISQVAENLGVSEKDLKDIKVEVKIAKPDETVIAKYNEMVQAKGAELVFPPVEFGIAAKTVKSDGTTEEVEISNFGIYVERVMEIPAGVDPSKITTGIVFNPDGTYNHVPTVIYQKDGKWYAKINSLTNSTYSIIWNPVTVKSVDNHWAKETVNDMAARLVIFNPETFEPNKAITRADFAEYIVRALGLYREGPGDENRFTDVKSTGARTLAILIATEYGLVSGYPDGTFRPEQRITREEAMAMYQRAMGLTKLTGSDKDRYQNYTDFAKVSSWAETSVKEALSAHVFNGTSATTISPKSNLTYAETAQAIKNLLVESKLIN